VEFDQTQPFEMRQDREGADALTLTLCGEFDLGGCEEFEGVIRGLDGTGKLVIDLAGLTFIDSSGIRALLASKRRAEEAGVELSVHVPENGQVRQVLELTGVDRVFNGAKPS
jgi:anti-sigma B factor antagonist